MAVPDFQSVMLPFLEALQGGSERTMRDLTGALAGMPEGVSVGAKLHGLVAQAQEQLGDADGALAARLEERRLEITVAAAVPSLFSEKQRA